MNPVSPAETRSWHKNCVTQTTSWSPCSKSCGRGLSLRISNANDQCELVKESRLCNLRPCEVDITKHIKVEADAPLKGSNGVFQTLSSCLVFEQIFSARKKPDECFFF